MWNTFDWSWQRFVGNQQLIISYHNQEGTYYIDTLSLLWLKNLELLTIYCIDVLMERDYMDVVLNQMENILGASVAMISAMQRSMSYMRVKIYVLKTTFKERLHPLPFC